MTDLCWLVLLTNQYGWLKMIYTTWKEVMSGFRLLKSTLIGDFPELYKVANKECRIKIKILNNCLPWMHVYYL